LVTREQIKEEIEKIPDECLDEAYTLLRKITSRTKPTTWTEWETSLEKFTPDFMDDRKQPLAK
jgi:hypothetical protein